MTLHDPWEAQVGIRFVDRGDGRLVLQQYWQRKVIEFREYGGRSRKVESVESEWRDVPVVFPVVGKNEG